mgnify:CR=1 FL=1
MCIYKIVWQGNHGNRYNDRIPDIAFAELLNPYVQTNTKQVQDKKNNNNIIFRRKRGRE